MDAIINGFQQLLLTTGIYGFLQPGGWGNALMILVGFVLLYLGIKKEFEPLLLVPIAMGCILSNIPLKRFGQPEEIAEAALFLAKAKYITGQVISVNGGLYL